MTLKDLAEQYVLGLQTVESLRLENGGFPLGVMDEALRTRLEVQAAFSDDPEMLAAALAAVVLEQLADAEAYRCAADRLD